jgi:hypothetical protein
LRLTCYVALLDPDHASELSMAVKSRYLFVASMDVDPDKEALFNEVYDTEQRPQSLEGARRARGLALGG